MTNHQPLTGLPAILAFLQSQPESEQRDSQIANCHRIMRQRARGATSRLTPADPKAYVDLEWRRQWSGLHFIEVCQNLAKNICKKDVGGRGGDPTPENLAKRNESDRRVLALALTELQVRHAEALGEDPATWIRPIAVYAADAAPAEANGSSTNGAAEAPGAEAV